MRVSLRSATPLRFDDGAPVRAASGAAPWRDGVLVAQDDATHAAHVRPDGVTRVRLLPPVDGLDVFHEADGTKHLKPDLEAACTLPGGAVLLLGSGSTDRRTRWVLLDGDAVRVADLAPLYARVRRLLDVPEVNLEGACVVGGRTLRWFHRGVAGAASGSVDLPLQQVLAAFDGAVPPVGGARSYDLQEGLAITDALPLPDGRVLVSTAAEDSPDAVADGPVRASGLAVLDGEDVVDAVALPLVDGEVAKLEGLCEGPDGVVGVVDADDPGRPSLLLVLDLEL